MITNSKQKWAVGHSVKVGFLTLTVVAAIATPGDFAPDAYILKNTAGTQLYKFVPHNGVEKISANDAQALFAESNEFARLAAVRAVAKAQADATKSAAINAISFA